MFLINLEFETIIATVQKYLANLLNLPLLLIFVLFFFLYFLCHCCPPKMYFLNGLKSYQVSKSCHDPQTF